MVLSTGERVNITDMVLLTVIRMTITLGGLFTVEHNGVTVAVHNARAITLHIVVMIKDCFTTVHIGDVNSGLTTAYTFTALIIATTGTI